MDAAVLTTEATGAVTWTDWVTAISSGILALFALFGVWQLLEVRRDRHFRVMSDILQRWDALAEQRRFSTKYTPSALCDLVQRGRAKDSSEEDRSAYIRVMDVSAFFEDVGGYVNQKALTAKVVADYLASDVIDHHRRWKETIDWLKENVRSTNLSNFDTLAGNVKKEWKKNQARVTNA